VAEVVEGISNSVVCEQRSGEAGVGVGAGAGAGQVSLTAGSRACAYARITSHAHELTVTVTFTGTDDTYLLPMVHVLISKVIQRCRVGSARLGVVVYLASMEVQLELHGADEHSEVHHQ